jgi:molybdate/tungstate transport system substrate-binding protein
MKKIIPLLLITLLFSMCNSNQQSQNEEKNELSGDVIIFHAGSLSVPLKLATEEFKKLHPGVNFFLESAGSVKCARKITDLNKVCDIMASADYTVIDEMLIPEHTNWNIKFASNEMCIVYHEASRYSEEINQDNWYEILMKDDVVYGRSDPNADPCGYRAVLVSQLAEKHYKQGDFSAKLLAKDTKYIRPKETDLLALLETNTIDYIFLYRSVAQQHGLKYLILPDEINLKKTEHADFYRTATVEINGKEPGEKITKKGEPMVYGITLLNNAPNKNAAAEFLKFMLSKDGGIKIMEENGQPSMVPSKSESYEAIPLEFKAFAVPN